ncbi:FG-GAP-like repeat-containing protein [Hymenobacter coalescens]
MGRSSPSRLRRLCWGGALALAGLALSPDARAQLSVVSRQPARNAPAAPRNTALTLGFSQAVSAASAPNLRVYGTQLRGKRPGGVAGGGTSTLTFTPSQSFAPGELVSVSLPASISSTGGNALPRQVYQFTAATGGPGRGFFLDTAVVGNTRNRHQLLGDVDNDGDLDLVTTGALFGCRIFLNDGQGHYRFKTGISTGQEPTGAVMADVDQDGDLDFLVGDADFNTVTVCLNDGTGEFLGSVTGAQNAPVGARPVGVAAGDVDGDGDLDFVTANADGASSTVRVNNGSGLFSTATTVSMGTGPTSVALADIDNDGDLDLLTTNEGTFSNPTGVVNVSRNNGSGSFGAYTSVAVGLQPSELALADVDHDGDLDLLTANAGAASVSLRLNTNGTFSGSTTLALAPGSTPSGLRPGDVDADGDLDLVVAQGTGGRVITYLNAGGTFTPQGRQLRLNLSAATAVPADGVVLGDVDGDLDLDLLTSDGQGQVILSRNAGTPLPLPAPIIASLTPASGPIGTSVILAGSALTDVTEVRFNGTPAPGFVLRGAGTELEVSVPAGATSGPVTVVTEDAGTATSPGSFTVTIPVPVLLTGITPARHTPNAPLATSISPTFSAPITAATAEHLRVFGNLRRGRRAGTLTGAGTTTLTFDPAQDFAPGELVSVSLPNRLQTFDGNRVNKQVVQFTAAVGGTGRHDFVVASTMALPSTAGFQAGDLDNDGDVDVAVPAGAQGVQLRLNNGSGTFSAAPAVASSLAADVIVLGDVDADGDLDLLSSSANGSGAVWRNDGTGTFVSAGAFSALTNLRKLLLADVDADGDLDLLTVNSTGISTLLNTGTGSFPTKTDVTLPITPTDAAVGDVDRDGDLDLVLPGQASSWQNNVLVVLNDGNGTFGTTASQTLTTDATARVALGDLDADGDLDLALMSLVGSQYQTIVRLNDGSGRFGSAVASVALGGPTLALADADGDGDLDLVTYAGVGLNNGSGGFAQTARTTSPGTTVASQLILADLDSDLDLDMLTDDQTGQIRAKLNRPGPPPALTSLAPESGPVGSSVLLTGEHLRTASAVTLNGVPVTAFTVLSASQLMLTVPAGASTGPVAVTTPGGTATSPTPFTVIQPLAVTALQPTRHALTAPRTAAVSVTFARPVAASSANELRVFSHRRGGRLAGTVSGGGTSTLTFTPAQPFAAGDALSLSIPDRVTGTDGSRALRQSAQFTVAAHGTGTGLFLPSNYAGPHAAYNTPYGFAVGDWDGDGDQDLATTKGSLRFNDGQGAFPDSIDYVLYPQTPFPRHIVAGDVDGDGDLDLVTTSGHLDFNNGQGTFAQQPQIAGLDADTRDLALGDIDSDGDLDFVAPIYARDSVLIGFNDGAGRFNTRLKVRVGRFPASIALGDVDGDGDLDFVTGNEGTTSSTVSVGFNNGIGWYADVQTLSAGSDLLQVALGDLDGDQDLDLVTSNGLVRFNDGRGSFSGSQTTVAGTGLALADVDSDGDLDLIMAGLGGAALRRNDGTGLFSGTETAPLGTGSLGRAPQLADLDADGDLDLLLANTNGNEVHALFNQRVAPPVISSFAAVSDVVGALVTITGTDLIGTSSVSFNGTPATTFTVLTASQLQVRVPAGATTGPLQVTNPAGTAASATAFTVLQPVAVVGLSPRRNATVPRNTPVSVQFGQSISANTAANLAVFSQRRGGLLAGTRGGAGSATLSFTPSRAYEPGELLSVSIPSYVDANQRRVTRQVYQFRAAVGGTGRGTMSAPTQLFSASDRPPQAADVDGDGDLDLIGAVSTQVYLRLNTGNGDFASPVTLLNYPRETIGGLTLGDVDGDGDLDLAVADVKDYQHNSVVNIRLNNGQGAFSGTMQVPVDEGPHQAALVDIDADGDLDLVTGNGGRVACTTSVRYNDGQGHFTRGHDQRTSVGSGSITHMVFGDVDADGDLDMLFSTYFAAMLRLNDGQGHFTRTTTSLPIPGNFTALALSDVDTDGDLDIMILLVNNGLTVRINDGAGNFPTLVDSSGPTWIHGGLDGMAVGDLDADGDPDVALTGYYNDRVLILLNDGQGFFTDSQRMQMNSAARPYAPLLGDIDRDGDLDLIHATFSSGLQRYFNGSRGPTAAAAAQAPAGVKLYPNPAHGQFVVEIPAELRAAAARAPLRLYNSVGQLVREQPVQLSANGRQTLPVADLPAGIYTLHLSLGAHTAALKVVLY